VRPGRIKREILTGICARETTGCEASSPESPAHNPSGSLSKGSSQSRIGGIGSPTRAAQKQRFEAVNHFARDWIVVRGGEGRKDDDVTVASVVNDCTQYFAAWPRGDKAGMLLAQPTAAGSTPLAERGVKLEWLHEAWNRMKAQGGKGHVPTRAFVELLVRPLVLEQVGNFTLFDYIPPAYRAKPFIFVSHAWDGWLKQCFFLPEHVTRDWPEDAAVWMDIFAVNQVDEVPQAAMLGDVKTIVQQVANTLLVLPGDGIASFALLPALRSWCLYEVACTPANCISFRMSMHSDLGDADFHEQVLAAIGKVSVRSAKASFAQDKTALDEAIDKDLGGIDAMDARVQGFLRQAFASQYATVTSPSKLALENRAASLGDYYTANTPVVNSGEKRVSGGSQPQPAS